MKMQSLIYTIGILFAFNARAAELPTNSEDMDFGLESDIVIEEQISDENNNEVTSSSTTEEVVEQENTSPVEDPSENVEETASQTVEEVAEIKVEAPAETAAAETAEEDNNTTEVTSIETNAETKTNDTVEQNSSKESSLLRPNYQNKADYNPEISFYIQNMKLSVDQLDMAKFISDDSRLKQEQLLKSIYLLRQQARDIEAKSLTDFEKILNDEQKAIFKQLKALQEEQRNRFELINIDLSDENAEEETKDSKENSTEEASEAK